MESQGLIAPIAIPQQDARQTGRSLKQWAAYGVAAVGACALAGAAVASAGATKLTPEYGVALFNEMEAEKVVYGEMSSAEVMEAWGRFKTEQARSFAAEEETFRFDVFSTNLKFIDKLNTQNPHALFGLNKYADRTDEERKVLRNSAAYSSWASMKDAAMPAGHPMREAAEAGPAHAQELARDQRRRRRLSAAELGKHESKDKDSSSFNGVAMEVGEVDWVTDDDCQACKMFRIAMNYTSERSPKHFDWRELGAVTDVKSQGGCSSDWAFAAVADIEGSAYLGRAGMAFAPDDDADGLVDLSVQQLIACDANDDGCQGGYTFQAYQYVEAIGGLLHDSDYPYEAICTTDDCDGGVSKPTPTCDTQAISQELHAMETAPVGAWAMVAMGEEYEDLLKVAMLRNGPIAATLNALGMEFYIKGVTGCAKDSKYCEAGDIDHTETCNPNTLDHSVALVGYGTEGGMDYWVAKNSWGAEWGSAGYYRIIRGENHCGVANFATHSNYLHPEHPHQGHGR